MSNPNNKDVTSGITSIIAIVLFVTGFVFNQLPIEITRPKGAEMKSLEVKSPQEVDARLWQDPFSAVKNHIESESKGNIFKSLEEMKEHEVAKLKKDINDHLKDINDHLIGGKTVTVLGVMVNAGPYPEYAEQRRRMRYAVLAGLANENYVPENDEHIGYVRTQSGYPCLDHSNPQDGRLVKVDTEAKESTDRNDDQCRLELPEIIPFEWLRGTGRDEEKRKRGILIVWIAEEYFSDQPYYKLLSLFHSLKCSNCNTNNYKVKVIGPFNSEVFRKIADEKPTKKDKDIEFYSATITVSPQFIMHTINTVPEKCKNEKDCKEKLEGIFNNRLFRTIHSDRELAKTLIEELNERNINPEKDKILLLSEWDTFYGRYLPITVEHIIKESLQNKYSETEVEKKLKEILPRYTYLRGLDGDIPASKNEEGKQDKQKNQTAGDQQLSKERPEGTSQLDYITRLADKIAADIEENNLKGEDNRVKAIGLLGSDADDKLILLQALRPKLPGNMVFFTTDMDARLIPHGSHDWGRNLIVASSFGLNLNDDFQRGIPPFRDVYQTSTFLATQLAVCDTDLEDKHKLLDGWLEEEPPRLFEIGRTKEFNITPSPTVGKNETTKAEQTENEKVCSLIKTSSALNPPVPRPIPIEKVIQIFKITLILISITLLLFVLGILRKNFVDEIRKKFTLPLLPTLIVVCLIIIILLTCIFTYIAINYDKIYEPLLWFQGISIWPTEIIRLCIIILSLCLLWHSWAIIKKDKDNLETTFFPNNERPKNLEKKNIKFSDIFSYYHKKYDGKNSPLEEVKELFNHYSVQSGGKYSLIRTFIFFLLVSIFSYLLFFELFPFPYPPARGHVTFIIDYVLLGFSIVFSCFLLFFITDAFRCSEGFLEDMTNCTTEWPSDTINCYTSLQIPAKSITKSPIRTNNDLVNDWLEVKVAAIHTESILKLIRYPFIILILYIFSINHLFDNWAITWPITITITLIFIVLIFHAYWLQRASEKLRDSALDHLYKKLTWAKGDQNAGDIANQLELLIEQTNNLKQGAFQPFLQRPLLQSMLALLGSLGGLQLLEYFFR